MDKEIKKQDKIFADEIIKGSKKVDAVKKAYPAVSEGYKYKKAFDILEKESVRNYIVKNKKDLRKRLSYKEANKILVDKVKREANTPENKNLKLYFERADPPQEKTPQTAVQVNVNVHDQILSAIRETKDYIKADYEVLE